MSKLDWIFNASSLTPREFELAVLKILESAGADLESCQVTHREKLAADDGTYEIDVLVRFNAFGANFLLLGECKHEQRAVEREDVQILNDRLRAVGAQKGIIFSTSGFQSGAITYAKKHGIALVKMCEDRCAWMTKSYGHHSTPAPETGEPRSFIGYLFGVNDEGTQQFEIVSSDHPKYLRAILGIQSAAGESSLT